MKVSKPTVDRLGAYAGAICAVHCVLTGFAIGLISVLGLGFLASPVAEGAFLLSAAVLGVVALVHGHRKHHSLVPAWIFIAGLSCLLISHFAFAHGHGHGAERQAAGASVFSILGGLSLVAFHVTNQRLQQACGCRHCSGHDA